MPRRSGTISSRKKRLDQQLKEGLESLKSTRGTIREATKSVFNKRFKAFGKIPAADYRKMMQLEKSFDLYKPKSTKLTPYRKRAIVKHWQDFERTRRNATFGTFPSASKKQQKRIVADLKKAYPKSKFKYARVGKHGIWVPKEDKDISATVGELHYDKDIGAYAINLRQPTRKGRIQKAKKYIASSEVLEKKQNKIEKHLEKLKAKLGKNQKLRIIIGQNTSRSVFTTAEQMFKYADRYYNSPSSKAAFLNEMVIAIVTKGPPVKVYRGRGRKRKLYDDKWTNFEDAFRVSNLHEVNVDDWMEAQSEQEYDEPEDDE